MQFGPRTTFYLHLYQSYNFVFSSFHENVVMAKRCSKIKKGKLQQPPLRFGEIIVVPSPILENYTSPPHIF